MLRAFIEDWPHPAPRETARGRFVGEDRVAVAAASSGARRPSQPRPPRREPRTQRDEVDVRFAVLDRHAVRRMDGHRRRRVRSRPTSARRRLLAASSTARRSTSAWSFSARRKSSSSSLGQACRAALRAALRRRARTAQSRRVSYGVLNLTHRDSHAEPRRA